MPPPYEELVLERHPLDLMFPISSRHLDVITVNGEQRTHYGVDIVCPVGTPVYAGRDAKVVDFLNDGGFGLGVCLDYTRTEWYLLHAHLSRVDVKVGDEVVAGQQIGLSGNTGSMTTGPHLHWQACSSTSFPRDPTQNTDPLSFRVVPPTPPKVPGLAADQVEAVLKLIRAEFAAWTETTLPALWRMFMRYYWVNSIGGDYTDAAGKALPPDEDVVNAMLEALGCANMEEKMADMFESMAKLLRGD